MSKYRIIEEKDHDGNSRFSVKEKKFIFWFHVGYRASIIHTTFSPSKRKAYFKTFEEARDAIIKDNELKKSLKDYPKIVLQLEIKNY